MECEMVVSIIQTNAGLPFTFSPYKFIKENMFFVISRYISYLEANRVKNLQFLYNWNCHMVKTMVKN